MAGTLKRYNGSDWDRVGGGSPIIRAATAPSSPATGDIWVDTATSFAQGTLLEAETTVSGSAVTSVSFTGLDGNAAGGYVLEGSFSGDAGLTSDVKIYFNGNTTDVNYYTEDVMAYNSTPVAIQRAYPKLCSPSTRGGSFNANITRTAYGYIESTCTYSSYDGTYSRTGVAGVVFTASNTNITNITVSSYSGTAVIGIGSTFRLYRRK
jgi:hypothetical protein